MAASKKTVENVYNIVVKYVDAAKITPLLEELSKVDGNASFKATVGALLDFHLWKASRPGRPGERS